MLPAVTQIEHLVWKELDATLFRYECLHWAILDTNNDHIVTHLFIPITRKRPWCKRNVKFDATCQLSLSLVVHNIKGRTFSKSNVSFKYQNKKMYPFLGFWFRQITLYCFVERYFLYSHKTTILCGRAIRKWLGIGRDENSLILGNFGLDILP